MKKSNAFILKLQKRFSLRLHMTLILMATAMAGAVASKLLLMAGLHNPAIRYPLTVIIAYGIFFVAIKFWLWIIVGSVAVQSKLSDLSLPDISSLPGGGGSSASAPSFSGGGGGFGGGGASGSWGDAAPSSGSSGGGSSGGGGGSFDLDLDEGAGIIIVLILLGILLAAIFGAGIYLIYQAPSILSEVAFDSVLAMVLAKKSKNMVEPNWVGNVFRATWKEFAIILAIAAVAGIAIHLIFPGVTKLSQFAPYVKKLWEAL
jgi:hypothetical protein